MSIFFTVIFIPKLSEKTIWLKWGSFAHQQTSLDGCLRWFNSILQINKV